MLTGTQIHLVPIDHGYCLPETLEDCTFDWLYWPQACQPYTSSTVDYIDSLDAEQDIAMLKFYGWDVLLECARTLCEEVFLEGVSAIMDSHLDMLKQ
ncbi:hypothetical protein SAY87_015247 [Trapa incisa]|uniref:1-phosphatidylinositol 4-kinase n=1 Tax=Trapa incisa TaxID=236973 RepID=A0AAN7GLD6_9MYRT|nr:hypothetical protein SAY87_015247 [Trapa incisa]